VPRSPDWPRGVMTIQNAASYIFSLFAFEVRADLYESRIFYMDHIMPEASQPSSAMTPRRRSTR
jgi:hypothetical protein